MARFVDVTGDVATDVETHRAFPLFAKTPPEAEGYTCGLLFAGEFGADGSVDVVIAEPRDADEIFLGDSQDWTGGLVVLAPTDSIAEALARLNVAAGEMRVDSGLELPLGDETPTLYEDSPSGLQPNDTVTHGLLKVDQKVGQVAQELADLVIEGVAIPVSDDVASDGVGLWDEGAIEVDPEDSVSQVLSGLNKKVGEVAETVDNLVFEAIAIPLGDDVQSDGASLWDDGAVELTPETSTAEAISALNGGLKVVSDWVENYEPPAQDGFHIALGDIEADGDGSWAGGAVPLTNEMPVSEGIDRINEVLGKLIPAQPPQFPNGTLSVSNGAGASPRLASGVTDNAGAALAAGVAVTRITAAGVSSNTFGDVGPGDIGTLAVSLNGAVVGSRVLSGTGDNGSYGGLVIADQKDFPVSTPGFWKSMDVSLSNVASPVGVNQIQITHSEGGSTNLVTFVRDTFTATPAVSGGSVVEHAAGAYAYSSGVPHYGTGGQLAVDASLNNFSGETYYGGSDPFVISGTDSIFTNKTCSYAAIGVSTPIARDTTAAQALTQQIVDVDGSGHRAGQVRGQGRNVNGAGALATLSTKTVLVKRGSAAGRVDENAVTAIGGNAVRKGQDSGDTPAGAPATWDSTAALAAHEAAVVGGVLRHDQTDYSTGYLPEGPDLSSGRSGAQYVTFSFSRTALSAFKIVVSGSYAGCRIRLPGASDSAPNAPNGWWDAFKAYDGAGVPGENGDPDAGCALGAVMSGGSGTFQITFGTQSSTNATGNEILIRFRLNPGQQITALSFTA